MGLFSSKTKYYVASQIYNLAGNLSDRPDYMKSLTLQAALSQNDIADHIQQGIFQGPGFSLRAFQKWARTNYAMGMPSADITVDEVPNIGPIQSQIPLPSGSPAGTRIMVINAVLTDADTQIWAEKHLLDNYPQLLTKAWTADSDDTTVQITIEFGDNTPDIVFTPTNWVGGAKYLVARYRVNTPGVNGVLEFKQTTGPFNAVASVGLRNYSEISREDLPVQSFDLHRRHVVRTEYRDGTPPSQVVIESDTHENHTPERIVYQWDQNMGFYRGTKRIQILRRQKNVLTNKGKRTAVTRTVVNYSDRTEITTISQDITYNRIMCNYYEQDRQGVDVGRDRIFIYRMGTSNPVLNAIRSPRANFAEFYPIMPLRLNNYFIDEAGMENSVYPHISKAYKKAFGSNIDMLLDELKDNENVDDLDFAFLVFGVALNETDPVGKRYMYEFFNMLRGYQKTSKSEYINYQQGLVDKEKEAVRYDRWEGNAISRRYTRPDDDGTDVPDPPSYPPPETSSFNMQPNIPLMPWYNITISWTYIHQTLGIGKGRPGAKKGDCWFELGSSVRGEAALYAPDVEDGTIMERYFRNRAISEANKRVYMYHQTGPLTYRKLEIVGLKHSNYVYKNKYVDSQAYDTIDDENEESPFFVPLHYPTLKLLSIRDQNQLATCSRLLLLNSYEKVKIKWYQRGIFKVIFAIAMIAISVLLLGPGAVGAMPGLLGTNSAVGTLLGLAGTTAVIAGAAVNMVAAMVLTTIIQSASTSLFGEKWGAMIGTIVTFFAMQVGAGLSGSFNINWTDVFSPKNIIGISQAVAKGYAGYMQGSIKELTEDYEEAANEYTEQMKAIEDATNELLGQNAWINPMLMTDIAQSELSNYRESSTSFLDRTLLTGTDIAEMTCAMIAEFPTLSLQLPEAII